MSKHLIWGGLIWATVQTALSTTDWYFQPVNSSDIQLFAIQLKPYKGISSSSPLALSWSTEPWNRDVLEYTYNLREEWLPMQTWEDTFTVGHHYFFINPHTLGPKAFFRIRRTFTYEPVMGRFFVAPDGDDESAGTADSPVASLARAMELIRMHNSDMSGNLLVEIAAGTYNLSEPLLLTTADSGSNGFNVILRSSDGIGKVQIRGAEAITGWELLDNGNWKAFVGSKVDFTTLYQSDRRLDKARYPSRIRRKSFPMAQYPYLVSTAGSGVLANGQSEAWIEYGEGDLVDQLLSPATLKINIFPNGTADWHRHTFQVNSIDVDRRRIYFNTLGLSTPMGAGARYFLQDQASFLNVPGEFFLNRDTGEVILYPLDGANPNETEILVPKMRSLIRVEGDAPDRPAHNIVFDGLHLSSTDALSPVVNYWNLDWGRDDDAIIYLLNTEQIAIVRCRLSNSGRHGILMPGANRYNRVEACLIEDMGVSGILISTTEIPRGDNGAAIPNEGHLITNTRIKRVGELNLYAEGIGIFNSRRNTISYCDIYDSARYAVSIRGRAAYVPENPHFRSNRLPTRDNHFKYLRIFDCGQDGGDLGALHAAVVNIPNGPDRNTFEQITIENTYAVEDMADIPPDGIYLDWPNLTMNQIFRNVHIFDSSGMDMRPHGLANLQSAHTDNVSWETGFNTRLMAYDQIGVRIDFPAEFGGRNLSFSTPPTPQGLIAKALSFRRIRVEWEPVPEHPLRNATYQIFRNGIKIGTTQASQWLDSGLSEQTLYSYRVRALWHLDHEGDLSDITQVLTPANDQSPEILGVRVFRPGDKVGIAFSEPVSVETTENTSSYEFAQSDLAYSFTHLAGTNLSGLDEWLPAVGASQMPQIQDNSQLGGMSLRQTWLNTLPFNERTYPAAARAIGWSGVHARGTVVLQFDYIGGSLPGTALMGLGADGTQRMPALFGVFGKGFALGIGIQGEDYGTVNYARDSHNQLVQPATGIVFTLRSIWNLDQGTASLWIKYENENSFKPLYFDAGQSLDSIIVPLGEGFDNFASIVVRVGINNAPEEYMAMNNLLVSARPPARSVVKAKQPVGNPHLVFIDLDSALDSHEETMLQVKGIKDLAKEPNELKTTWITVKQPKYPRLEYQMNRYSIDNMIKDSSGAGLDGQVQGDFDWMIGAGIGDEDALYFNGMSTYVRGPETLQLGAGDFTLSAWIRKDYDITSNLAGKGLGWGPSNEWNIVLRDQHISFRVGNQWYSSAAGSLQSKQWHHIAVKRKNGIGQWYIDGEASGESFDALNGIDLSSNHPLLIGRREYAPSPWYFSGIITDFRIYDQALDPDELRAIYLIPTCP